VGGVGGRTIASGGRGRGSPSFAADSVSAALLLEGGAFFHADACAWRSPLDEGLKSTASVTRNAPMR